MRIWVKVKKKYPKFGLIILEYIAFIALGMPDGLLGVAWPSIWASFSIPLDALGLLLSAGVVGYLTSSFFSSPLIARLGVGNVLAASCTMTGAGLIGYTIVPVWWMMVLLGVVAGLGAGGLGFAIIPGLMGILARQVSIEIIPVCLIVLFAGLLALYALAAKSRLNA